MDAEAVAAEGVAAEGVGAEGVEAGAVDAVTLGEDEAAVDAGGVALAALCEEAALQPTSPRVAQPATAT